MYYLDSKLIAKHKPKIIVVASVSEDLLALKLATNILKKHARVEVLEFDQLGVEVGSWKTLRWRMGLDLYPEVIIIPLVLDKPGVARSLFQYCQPDLGVLLPYKPRKNYTFRNSKSLQTEVERFVTKIATRGFVAIPQGLKFPVKGGSLAYYGNEGKDIKLTDLKETSYQDQPALAFKINYQGSITPIIYPGADLNDIPIVLGVITLALLFGLNTVQVGGAIGELKVDLSVEN